MVAIGLAVLVLCIALKRQHFKADPDYYDFCRSKPIGTRRRELEQRKRG